MISKKYFENESNEWKKSKEEKIDDIVLVTRVHLIPEYTESDSEEEKVKLKIVLNITKNKNKDFHYKVIVTTHVFDANGEELEHHVEKNKFKDDKTKLHFSMDLISQEKVQESTSKKLKLEIQVTLKATESNSSLFQDS